MPRPLIFCLTPVKNEAWILERFLKCASVWADHIIIADQGSTDGSREIAREFPKVTLIDNPSENYNEAERQQMLLNEARRIPGPKVLLALDADEFLSANLLSGPEWETILNAAPGTVISFQWPEIQANVSDLSYFYFPSILPVGFVDDGSAHIAKTIHSSRVPAPPGCRVLAPTQIKLMHYCMFDLDRFYSRIRWYQCFEYLTQNRRPIELYRFYHLVLFVPSSLLKPVPKEWIQGYEERGIDMTTVHRDGAYRWDNEVLAYIQELGSKALRRMPIWEVDWGQIHRRLYPDQPIKRFADPRSRFEQLVHRWLRKTQPDFSLYASQGFWRKRFYRCADIALAFLGW